MMKIINRYLNRKFIMVILLGIVVLSVGSQTMNGLKISFFIDWVKAEINFLIIAPVDKEGLPASKQEAEGLINRFKAELIKSLLLQVPLDSWGTFASKREIDSGYTWDLDKMSSQTTKRYSVFSDDMHNIHVVYSISFKNILKNISLHYNSLLLPDLMPSEQIFDYTGIVIVATSPLIIKKTAEKDYLKPSLLPSIYTEDGRMLLGPTLITNKVLNKWGVVSYSYSSNVSDWPRDRIGTNPLIISAKEILNNSFSDIVISNSDANIILGSNRGLDILKGAKVLIIIKEAEQISSFAQDIETEKSKTTSNSLSSF